MNVSLAKMCFCMAVLRCGFYKAVLQSFDVNVIMC